MACGTLIVLEGLDGSGKATQTANVVKWMESLGRTVTPVSYPDYQSDASAPVRMYLSGAMGAAGDVNAYAASSFYAVDRFAGYQTHWKKCYESGHTVVADRYTTSNAVYQMSKLPREEWNDYLRWLEDYEYNRMGLPQPDCVIYLDMHPETSRALLAQRYARENTQADVHESDHGYLESCRRASTYAAMRLGWQVVVCDRDRQPLPVEDVFEKIRHKAERVLQK